MVKERRELAAYLVAGHVLLAPVWGVYIWQRASWSFDAKGAPYHNFARADISVVLGLFTFILIVGDIILFATKGNDNGNDY